MGTRLELQTLLENALGSRNVYFQPPESLKMKYPAIVYKYDDIRNTFADNKVYLQKHYYQVIVIDSDPDSEVMKRVSMLDSITWTNRFVSDNLNHYVFTLYY